MDLGTILRFDKPGTTRGPGRRRVATIPAEREKHIQVLLDRCRGLSAPEISRLREISERTVWNWVRLALSYDDPRVHELVTLCRLR